MLKITWNVLPNYLAENLKRKNEVHQHNTTGGSIVYLESRHKISTKNNLFDKGIILYNEIPKHVRKIGNIKKFKTELKRYLMLPTN